MRTRSVVATMALLLAVAPHARAESASWPVYGQNISNTRVQAAEGLITKDTVGGLRQRWFFSTGRDVTGTPIVAEGKVFAADAGGFIYALDAGSGQVVWGGRMRSVAYGTPAYHEGVVYVGDNYGTMWALDASDGNVVWAVRPLDDDAELGPYGQFWGSPVPYGGALYVGMAGEDQEVTFSVTRKTWRGQIVALNLADGSTKWRTEIVRKACSPGEPGGDRCNGGSVWTTPAIDPVRGLAYFGTGNAYDAPAADTTDAMIAVDLDDGAIVATHQFTAGDAWSHNPQSICCNPDWDFGSSPALTTIDVDGEPVEVVLEGQKSGMFRAVRRDDLSVVWETHVAGGRSGGFAGGILASPAVYGGKVFAGGTDPVVDLPGPAVARQFALDTGDGSLAWSAVHPVWMWSAPAVANGVVFQGSSEGILYARDGDTGDILWMSAPLGGIIASGASIANGMVFIGTGCCGGAAASSGIAAFGF